jgi:hypothetical protein
MLSLTKAVKAYRFLNPPYLDPMWFMGTCSARSYDFYMFCKKNFGITDLKVMCYGDMRTFFHAVNVRGDIGIDWTIRQFDGCEDFPYPYIYKIGQSRLFNSPLISA